MGLTLMLAGVEPGFWAGVTLAQVMAFSHAQGDVPQPMIERGPEGTLGG